MIHKPSFASLLVSGPGQLKPFHAQNQSVAIPTAPPAGLRYGSLPPGIAQNSRFTGGVVGHQPSGQMFAPPDFSPPSYGALSPSFSPGVGGSPWGGPSFRPIAPPGSSPSAPRNPSAPVTGSNMAGGGSPAGAPGSSGGYHRVRGGLAGVLGGYSGGYSPYNPSPSAGTPASAGNPTGGYGGGYVPLGAALAAAAAAGRRGVYYE